MVWLLRHQGRWLVDVLVGMPTETWPVGEESRGREIRDFQLHRTRSKELSVLEYDSAYPPVLGPNIFLVVLTLHEPIARWMRKVLGRKQLSMRTCVLAPDEIPRSGPIDAHAEPRRALLEAMLHVHGDADLPLLTNALRALRRFEGNELLLYRHMLMSHMEEPMILQAYDELEPELEDEDWTDDELTPHERKSFLYVRGERQGLVRAILELLQRRGIEVDPASEPRILACRESEQLLAWLGKALTITRADELFDPE
jgi:hypothetical protein